MKFYAIAILVLAALAVIGGGGYALHQSWYGEGYNARVAQDASAYAAAEQKGRQAQSDADQETIGQLHQALDAEKQAAHDHDQQLANLRNSASSLQRRLHVLESQSPDAARWLATPIPQPVLDSVCWPAAGQSTARDCPGH